MLSSKILFSLMNIVSIAQANIDYSPERVQSYGFPVDIKKMGAERGLREWNEYEQLLNQLKIEYEEAVKNENSSITLGGNNAKQA